MCACACACRAPKKQKQNDGQAAAQATKQQPQSQKKKSAKPQQQAKQPQQQQRKQPAAAAAAPSSSSKPSKRPATPIAAAESSDEESSGDGELYTQDRLNGLALALGTDPAVSQSGLEMDSRRTAELFFEWLIFPMSIETFYSDYFEQKPLFISRQQIEDKLSKATLVTTKQTLPEMVPSQEDAEEDGAASSSKKKASVPKPSNKPAAVSTATMKTVANALPTEQVTVVELPPSDAPKPKSTPASTSASGGSSSIFSSPAHYYSGWFSIPDIHALLRDPKVEVQYRRDVDITRYRDGVRTTLNPQGRATEKEVSKFLSKEEACSLRFLCPQKYSDKLWRMLSRLDDFFGMQTGANSYYTPAGTQGFAPHYDDVDIFVIQTEGSKRWRLYPPRSSSEILPSVSSRNYDQGEIGQPVMDVLLRAGDFLYAPRGTIHQCVASLEEPSLHVTLSTCLGTNWAQYLSILLPRALQLAAEERADFRQSLPQGYERYMGVMHADEEGAPAKGRKTRVMRPRFMDEAIRRLGDMMDLDLLPMDAAADQMATEFMHGCVPVPPSGLDEARKRADFQQQLANQPTGKDGKKKSLFKGATSIRLVRAGVARITTSVKGDLVTLHHTMANSRLYKDQPLAAIDFPIGYAATLEAILTAYPKYIQLSQLPAPVIEGDEESSDEQALQDCVELVEQMFEEGILEVTNDAKGVPEALRKTGDSEEEEEDAEEAEGGEDDEEMGEDEDDDGAMDDEYDVEAGEDDEEDAGI